MLSPFISHAANMIVVFKGCVEHEVCSAAVMPSNLPLSSYPKGTYFIVLHHSGLAEPAAERCAGSVTSSLLRVFQGRIGPGRLLACARSWFRSREEKKL